MENPITREGHLLDVPTLTGVITLAALALLIAFNRGLSGVSVNVS